MSSYSINVDYNGAKYQIEYIPDTPGLSKPKVEEAMKKCARQLIELMNDARKTSYEVRISPPSAVIVTGTPSSNAPSLSPEMIKRREARIRAAFTNQKVAVVADGLKKMGREVDALYSEKHEEPRGVEPKFVGYKEWTKKDERNLNMPGHKFNEEWLKYPEKSDIRKHIQETFPKFRKRHFVKLDFAEGKKVTTDRKRALNLVKKYKYLPKNLAASVYLMAKTQTKEEANYSAVSECLANDIYNILGFGSGGAKARILKTTYEDGTPKLLIDSTEARGPNGEKAQGFGNFILEGEGRRGRFEGNRVNNLPFDTEELGKGLAIALFLGDRDKWGAHGDNLLFYEGADGKAHLLNLDPGKALESSHSILATDRLSYNKGIRSDLSFKDPPHTAGGYKNFTLFQDTLLSEKMRGVQEILDPIVWQEVESSFEAYMKQFPEFKNQLDGILSKLRVRREYFGKVFAKRKDLEPRQLDLIDNLEKLTSLTTNVNKVKKNGKFIDLSLNHLEVLPETRREWNLEKGYLVYQGPAAEDVEAKLKAFAPNVAFNKHNNEVKIKYNARLLEVFSERDIAAHKNQPLY